MRVSNRIIRGFAKIKAFWWTRANDYTCVKGVSTLSHFYDGLYSDNPKLVAVVLTERMPADIYPLLKVKAILYYDKEGAVDTEVADLEVGGLIRPRSEPLTEIPA